MDDWSDERSSPANTLPPGTPGASWRRVRFRRAVWCAYLLALAVTIYTLGLPTDRIYQATWIVAGLVAFTIDRPWQDHLRVVRDWLPLIAALVVYDLSRGFAHELGMPVRAEELVSVETWLFGGTIPTVWLQENLLSPTGELPWWTLLTGIVYTSHFIVPWVVAAVFYVYSRDLWSGYMRRVLLLSYLGLLTYILLPSVPPWLAAEGDVISGSVGRVAGFGFGVVPTDVSTRWLEAQSNPVAALPSLHAAFALLVAVALWPFAKNLWSRALLVAYPLAMAFVLVYGGEHYVVDVLAGWAYLGLAVLLARAWESRTTVWPGRAVTAGRPRRRW